MLCLLWRYSNPDRHFAFYSSSAVSQDLVILGGRDKLIHAIDRATGKARWTYQASSRVDASPVIIGQRVIAATDDGIVLELALDSGEEIWRFETGSGFVASPAVGNGRLVISTVEGLVISFGE